MNNTTIQAEQTKQVEQRFSLGKITQQGQYVNRQTGHLLVVNEEIETLLKNDVQIFKSFIAKDPIALEYTQVSENPKLPLEEVRIKAGNLKLPIGF